MEMTPEQFGEICLAANEEIDTLLCEIREWEDVKTRALEQLIIQVKSG